jgi:hypothetical protein
MGNGQRSRPDAGGVVKCTNPYGLADLDTEEVAQFLVACLMQHEADPRKVAGDLMRDYAQLHCPKAEPYDHESDTGLRLITGGAA